MKNKTASPDRLAAGIARQPLDPPLPFPMAGMAGRKERLATRVRDPLHVTALVLDDGKQRAAIVALDLLIVDPRLYAVTATAAAEQGVSRLLVNASHSHSAPGGYVDNRASGYFMGRYRPEIDRLLAERIRAALAQAAAALAPVTLLRRGTALVPGLTMNRRCADGPVDDRVFALEMTRESARPILLFSTSGHPVVVGFTQPDAASADYPGVARAALDADAETLYVPGALGGLNVLFPEMPGEIENHLALLGRLVVDGVRQALSAATGCAAPRLSAATVPVTLRRQFPPVGRGSVAARLRGALASSIGFAYSHLTSPRTAEIPVTVLSLGDVLIAGMPADFGVGATLELRRRLEALAPGPSLVASHTNSYAGYVHLEHEYVRCPRCRDDMFLYENAMGWYGPQVGSVLLDAAVSAATRARSA